MAAEGASLLVRLQADQAAARRAQEKDRVMLLGMVISELKNRESSSAATQPTRISPT